MKRSNLAAWLLVLGLVLGQMAQAAPSLAQEGSPEGAAQPQQGATRLEMSDEAFVYSDAGAWEGLGSDLASGGGYSYTAEAGASVSLNFRGDAFQLQLVQFRNFGLLEVYVDGALLDTLDLYSPARRFISSPVYPLVPGDHLLTLVSSGQANPASEGTVIAVDAVDVWQVSMVDSATAEPTEATPEPPAGSPAPTEATPEAPAPT
ncbi:MAG: hypothetical protein HC915_02610, partial [Anaerolineae bacterium]|nr:hypothetical protein [Anaerolineae bacterium]